VFGSYVSGEALLDFIIIIYPFFFLLLISYSYSYFSSSGFDVWLQMSKYCHRLYEPFFVRIYIKQVSCHV